MRRASNEWYFREVHRIDPISNRRSRMDVQLNMGWYNSVLD